MRLRQVVLASNSMEDVSATFQAVLGVEVCYRDPWIGQFSLRNVMMVLGDTFLEVLTPTAEGTTAGRYLERRGGDAGYMVVLQVDDLPESRRRVDELGVRVVNVTDRPTLKGMHLHPRDIGGAIVALNVAVPPGSWEGAGEWEDWKRFVHTDVTSEIVAVELGAEDPRALAQHWAEILGRQVHEDSRGPTIDLDRGKCRFVQDFDVRQQGVIGFDVSATDPTVVIARARDHGLAASEDSFELCGVTVRVVPAA